MANPAVREKSNVRKSYIMPVVISIALILSILAYYYPAFQQWDIPEEKLLLLNGEEISTEVYFENEEILLSADFIQSHLDPYFYYDENTEIAMITTRDKVLEMRTDELSGYINSKEINFEVPMQEINNELFLPIEPLAKLYNIKIKNFVNTNVLAIHEKDQPLQKAEISNDSSTLRTKPQVRSPWIEKFPEGKEVTVYHEEGNWSKVLTEDGLAGYLRTEQITLTERKEPEDHKYESPVKPLDGKINLTWDYLYGRAARFQDAPSVSGINVVSPTWFELADEDGNIVNNAYKPYIHWARDNNYQVWALFSNSFDPDITQEVLSDPLKRTKVRDQLLIFAEIYNLDGINFDFENMYYEDKRLYVQLIREVTPFLHEQGLTVSVDVTVPSQSRMWSMVYDREALAETVDYIMVMAYDQYPRNSDIAGPVSSLAWTEDKLMETLELIPNDRLILGVPFYTRLWTEVKKEDGSVEVSSQALGMESAEDFLQENNLEPTLDHDTGLMFAEHTEGNTTYKIWLETADSMKKRIELINKYDLAGVASWRRGFEKPEIWSVISDTLE